MFWRFGGYANISTLNNILEKPDVTLEEVLDESDLIQELKQSNTKLIEFLRDVNVLRKLLEYVTTPQTPRPEEGGDGEESDEEPIQEKSLSPFRRKDKREKSKRQEEFEAWDKADKARAKNAYTSCEILSSETWSILDSLMENQQLMTTFWDFMRRESPLDPTEANYFTKINETLLDKKTEEMIKFLQSMDAIIPAMLNHIDCAPVMDLMLKIISLEKSEGGYGVVDWLQSQDLIPRLLAFLEKEHSPGTQTAAGDFIKAIVTISANASQNEQSCIGPNNLTRQLVSEPCIENLLSNMLRGGNPLTVGVGMIIEVIRKNNSDYDPDVGTGPELQPSSNDPIYLGTLLRCFAKRVPDFMDLLLSPTHAVADGNSQITIKRQELGVAFGNKIEPLGFDRFKTCELMAELLHCSNMGLLNERGSEQYVRERDQERERLKAEGHLTAFKQPASAITEFSEDSTNFINGVSPLGLNSTSEEKPKLGVMNSSAEDDGFEDVGNSEDLAEEAKHDLDEQEPFDVETQPAAPIPILAKPVRPRLDLDEDFVDEPLSSPRLEAVDEKDAEDAEQIMPNHLDSRIEPLSPTSGLTGAVDNLAVEHHEAPSIDVTKSPEPMSEHEFHSSEAPPLPHRERHLEPLLPITPESSSPQGLSPHPDDEPAPLFADRPDNAPLDEDNTLTPENIVGHGDTILDTTQGDEGDTSRSILMSGNDQSFVPQLEYDVDGQPIVGDFLKMMFVEHKVVPTILDFFFRFPWNNFLHNVVYDVVQQVFNGPMDRGYNRTLAIDLFQTGRITECIVEGQAQSDEGQAKSNMRLGYMGHLTLVAEEVVKFSDRHPPELLSQVVLEKVTSQKWNEYVDNTLSETRERDNAILGGVRPDMSLGPRQAVLNAVNAAHSFGGGASTALANAGLNGNPGLDSMDLASNASATSNGNFGLSSGGSLLSGFGSSSDEEDEEMEEIAEADAGTGQDPFLPTAQPLSQILTPPTDPPPAPPPLNVTPSRARRQLAARLALHSQQKADADAETDDTTFSSSSAAADGHDPLSDSLPNNNKHLPHNLDDHSAHDDPLALIDDDDDDIDHLVDGDGHGNAEDEGEDIPFITHDVAFGSPLRASPPTHPRDGSDIDAILLGQANSSTITNDPLTTPTIAPPTTASEPAGADAVSTPPHPEAEAEAETAMGKNSHLTTPPASTTSPGHASGMRHLDLDDFANSPAADADDRGFDP